MKNKLKVILVLLIIAIIGVLVWTGRTYFTDKQQSNTVANDKTQSNGSNKENKVEDNSKKETKIEDKEEQNKKEEVKEEKTKEETSVSNEEKAIELAKKEYGTTDGVYFRMDQIKSSTQYIVSVRNNDTSVLAWYIVDVESGTVKDY